MNFTNFPNLRITYYRDKGWVVEIQKKKWYGKKYWIHIISYYGQNDKPYYFSDYDTALEEAVLCFKNQIKTWIHEE